MALFGSSGDNRELTKSVPRPNNALQPTCLLREHAPALARWADMNRAS